MNLSETKRNADALWPNILRTVLNEEIDPQTLIILALTLEIRAVRQTYDESIETIKELAVKSLENT